MRNQKIVESPADVPGAGRAHGTPPRVMLRTLLEFTKGVEKPSSDKGIEPGAFLGRETVVLHVGLGIREINFRVRDVEVAAENDGLFLLQLFKELQEILVPLLAIRQAGEFALALTYFKSPLVLSK